MLSRRFITSSSLTNNFASRTATNFFATSASTGSILFFNQQYSSLRFNSSSTSNKVKVTFIDGKKNLKKECEATIGKTLLNVGLENQMDIEAACDGTCACSTCHVYVDEEHFEKLEKATEDEEDMLDLALDRRHTSRLCCQLTVTKEFDGMVLELPEEVSSQM